MMFRPGDLISARKLRRIAEDAERRRRLISRDGINLSDSGIPLAWDGRTKRFTARLSGSTSPYSFAEVQAAPGGGWLSLSNGIAGTALAYERNGVSGLDTKVVMLEEDGFGAWRFVFRRKGTLATCHTFSETFNPIGCGLGNRVTFPCVLTGPSSYSQTATCNTSPGTVAFTGLTEPGVYHLHIAAQNRYAAYDHDYTIPCGGTGVIALNLPLASGYHCLSSACYYPAPDTLHLSGPLGSITLSYGLPPAQFVTWGFPNVNGWYGTKTVSFSNGVTAFAGGPTPPCFYGLTGTATSCTFLFTPFAVWCRSAAPLFAGSTLYPIDDSDTSPQTNCGNSGLQQIETTFPDSGFCPVIPSPWAWTRTNSGGGEFANTFLFGASPPYTWTGSE